MEMQQYTMFVPAVEFNRRNIFALRKYDNNVWFENTPAKNRWDLNIQQLRGRESSRFEVHARQHSRFRSIFICTYFNINPVIHISNTPHINIKKNYKTLPTIVQQLLLICKMIVWASMKRGITRKNTATTYWVKFPKIVYALCRIPYSYYIRRPCPMHD